MRLLRLFLLCATLLVPAMPALAADVCCLCERVGEDPKCITAPEETGRTFDPVTRTFLTADTADACSDNWTNTHGLGGWTCSRSVSATQCKPVGSGAGICQGEPVSYLEAAKQVQVGDPVSVGTASKPPTPAIIPNLNTPIPGFSFTGGEDVTQETSSLLAQYVAAAYRYGISITAIAATVMFVYGAFQYLVGSAITTVNQGKTIMQEAILGMLLVFGANMLLRTINPDTLSLKALDIIAIDAREVGNFFGGEGIGNKGDFTGLIANTPKDQVARDLIEGAKLASSDIDACAILTICEHESGLRGLWNGIQSGNPKESAIAFGACQQVARFLHDKNPIAQKLKKQFPDFPLVRAPSGDMPQADKLAVGEWLLTNHKGAGFVAALMFRANRINDNEITALGGYSVGKASIQNWQNANGCTPKNGVRIKTLQESGDVVFDESCLPEYIAVSRQQGSSCKDGGYTCLNLKPNEKGEKVGTCAVTGEACYGGETRKFARYVIQNYPRVSQQYPCQ